MSSNSSNQSYQLVIDILADLVKEAMATYDSTSTEKLPVHAKKDGPPPIL
ncbi:hypothetical protein [Paenibacillus odorifer]|nr:hypothetical protein [Paenibacillus odorifer]